MVDVYSDAPELAEHCRKHAEAGDIGAVDGDERIEDDALRHRSIHLAERGKYPETFGRRFFAEHERALARAAQSEDERKTAAESVAVGADVADDAERAAAIELCNYLA